MARYVLIVKESENDERVIYRFGPNEESLGRLQIHKSNGDVEELEPIPLPVKNPQAFFAPAAVKLRQHWQVGAFPEVTSWAS
jgi:hypothetical protein